MSDLGLFSKEDTKLDGQGMVVDLGGSEGRGKYNQSSVYKIFKDLIKIYIKEYIDTHHPLTVFLIVRQLCPASLFCECLSSDRNDGWKIPQGARICWWLP